MRVVRWRTLLLLQSQLGRHGRQVLPGAGVERRVDQTLHAPVERDAQLLEQLLVAEPAARRRVHTPSEGTAAVVRAAQRARVPDSRSGLAALRAHSCESSTPTPK